MLGIRLSDIELLECFHDITNIKYPLSFYREEQFLIDKPKSYGDRNVRELFDSIYNYAMTLSDGKIYATDNVAIRFLHKPTYTVLCVGYKNGIYRLGLEVENGDNASSIILLKK